MNCLVGGGDVGKSSVLEAISVLLSPAPGRVADEYDYFGGRVDQGFTIEAVIGALSDEVLRAWSVAPLWSWMAPDKLQGDPDPTGESVLVLRARGTEDLEIEHYVLDPSEGEQSLSPNKRRKFLLSTLGPAATAFRELRLSRGSLLARNIDREHLRGLAADAVQASREAFAAPEDVKDRLEVLSAARENLAPGTGPLSLGVLPSRSQSLLGMLGLFSEVGAGEVPVASAGLGTQQLTMFALTTTSLEEGPPIFVVDELESGLEPFRQRELVERIRLAIGTSGQAFVTTHSPAVVGELEISELNRVEKQADGSHVVISLPKELGTIKRQDPEGLLCRLPVVVEGQTELGLLEKVAASMLDERGTTLGALGIRLIDGEGQPNLFTPLRGLKSIGLVHGAFVDAETTHVGKRETVSSDPLVVYGSYRDGCGFEDALAAELSPEALDAIISLSTHSGHDASTSRYQQLNYAAGSDGRRTVVELDLDVDAREAFAQAANKSSWFKSRANAAVVADYLLEHHPTARIVQDVETFWRSVLGRLGIAFSPQRDAPGP